LTLKGVVLPSSIATTPISPGLRGPEPAQTKQVSKGDPLQGQKRPTICGLWYTLISTIRDRHATFENLPASPCVA
jgi:hypothetical protein